MMRQRLSLSDLRERRRSSRPDRTESEMKIDPPEATIFKPYPRTTTPPRVRDTGNKHNTTQHTRNQKTRVTRRESAQP